jgi:hypothetical protein
MAKHDVFSDSKLWIGVSIVFILTTVLLAVLLSQTMNREQGICNTCSSNGYNQGLVQGNINGYNLGYDTGYKEGNSSGFVLCNETCVKPIVNQTTQIINVTYPYSINFTWISIKYYAIIIIVLVVFLFEFLIKIKPLKIELELEEHIKMIISILAIVTAILSFLVFLEKIGLIQF